MRKPILEIVEARLRKHGGARKVIEDLREINESWDTIAARIEAVTKVRVSGPGVAKWVKDWQAEDEEIASRV